jgi:hypothetical protein
VQTKFRMDIELSPLVVDRRRYTKRYRFALRLERFWLSIFKLRSTSSHIDGAAGSAA